MPQRCRRRGHARRSSTRFTNLTIDTPGTNYGERDIGVSLPVLVLRCPQPMAWSGSAAFLASVKNLSITVHTGSPTTPRTENSSFSYYRRTNFATDGEALLDTGGNFSLFALGFCTLDGGSAPRLTVRIEGEERPKYIVAEGLGCYGDLQGIRPR